MKLRHFAFTATCFVALPLLGATPPRGGSYQPRTVHVKPSVPKSQRVDNFYSFMRAAQQCMIACAKKTSFPDKKSEALKIVSQFVVPQIKKSHPHSLLRKVADIRIYHDPEDGDSAANEVAYTAEGEQAHVRINTARFPDVASMEEALAHELVHLRNTHSLYYLVAKQIPDFSHPRVIRQIKRCNEVEADTFSLFNCDQNTCTFVKRRYQGTMAFLDAHERFEQKAQHVLSDLTHLSISQAPAHEHSRIIAVSQDIMDGMSGNATHPSCEANRVHTNKVLALAQQHNGVVPKREIQRLVAQNCECAPVVDLIRDLEETIRFNLEREGRRIHVPTRFPKKI